MISGFVAFGALGLVLCCLLRRCWWAGWGCLPVMCWPCLAGRPADLPPVGGWFWLRLCALVCGGRCCLLELAPALPLVRRRKRPALHDLPPACSMASPWAALPLPICRPAGPIPRRPGRLLPMACTEAAAGDLCARSGVLVVYAFLPLISPQIQHFSQKITPKNCAKKLPQSP